MRLAIAIFNACSSIAAIPTGQWEDPRSMIGWVSAAIGSVYLFLIDG
jgi:hypothetical protein